MAQDNIGKNSTKRRGKRPTPEIQYWDASHPIYSNPTAIMFGRPTLGSTESSSDDSQPKRTTSTTRREPRPPPPMKFSDASHPIFSNPTVIGFVPPKTSPPKRERPRSALEDMMSLSPQEIKEMVDLVLNEEDPTEEAPKRTFVSWIRDCITGIPDPKKILQKLRRD